MHFPFGSPEDQQPSKSMVRLTDVAGGKNNLGDPGMLPAELGGIHDALPKYSVIGKVLE